MKDRRSSRKDLGPGNPGQSLGEWLRKAPNASVRRQEAWSVALAACRIYELEKKHNRWYMRLLRFVTRQEPSPRAVDAPYVAGQDE